MVAGIGGSQLAVHGYGDVEAVATIDGLKKEIVIKKTLHVPGLGANLLSIGAVTALGSKVIFVGIRVLFQRDGRIEMVGERVGKNLYHMAIRTTTNQEVIQQDVAHLSSKITAPIDIWHQRLCHTNYNNILKMASLDLASGREHLTSYDVPPAPCQGCVHGKMHKKPFPTGRTRGTHVGHLIHSDLCGPTQIETPNG